ncbi:iron reductase domain protein [Hyaloscypha variabilis F]|uniref:Iron reductase domain protein n=1 Tax=Hyaloscypha variabilis (strain UAMH 11265 / GT02V1 / F) TaxID=1149755 RepID=A0A2J6RBK6_HYAVF|nr:iron reductase domain protein [Hyaloscypha variabilis F]
MRLLLLIFGALATCGVHGQTADSKVVYDPITHISYSSYTSSETGITFGVALPMNVSDPYDAIISITAPIANVTWAGFAWAGTMVWNPLTVAWPNGKTTVVSSRFAFGLSLPQAYDGAEYTFLKGTTVNSTHWAMTAKCSGCTSYQGNDGNEAVINGTGITQFAWAQGTTAVQTPSSNTSAFNVHQAFGKWYHDLNAARSPNFDTWVSSNLLAIPADTSSAVTTTSALITTSAKSTVAPTVSKPASTLSTSVVAAKPSAAVGSGKIPSTCSGAGAAVFPSVLASGWKATKVLGGLTSPRQLVWDSAGNMLMVQSGKGISVHTVGADGCITATKMLVSLNSLNHGLAMSNDGKTLYASSMTTVYAWPYTAASTSVGTRTTVITGMYNGGAHTTRTLQTVPQHPNLLVIAHGSNDNWDYAAGNAKTGRAIVKVFDLSTAPSSGYNYVSGGSVVGYGMRNEVGVAFDGNNMLWGVENSGDNFARGGKDIHENNPAEKLNYIGDVLNPKGTWFGYPTCFAVGDPSAFTDAKFAVGDQFVIAPNTTFKDATCNGVATPPALTFQAHSAPIDSKFDSTYSNLYVTFHGSWNRVPTTGFKLVVVPFTKGTDGAYRPVAPANSASGYTDVMSNPDVTKCTGDGPSFSSGCFRPAGLLFDSSDRLYMTSDVSSNAELWILGKE